MGLLNFNVESGTTSNKLSGKKGILLFPAADSNPDKNMVPSVQTSEVDPATRDPLRTELWGVRVEGFGAFGL